MSEPTSPSSRSSTPETESDQLDRLLIESSVAAAMLSISPRKLWELTKRNAIPTKRIGKSVRYSPKDLDRWIDAGCPTEANAAETLNARSKRWTPA